MKTLSFKEYKEIRDSLYKSVTTLSKLADQTGNPSLNHAAIKGDAMLDAVNQCGYVLGYLDTDNNEYKKG